MCIKRTHDDAAGSGGSAGFSTCQTAGAAVPCQWNDTSQAEAYAHTLTAFYKAFPEYGANELYMTGESYVGHQYLFRHMALCFCTNSIYADKSLSALFNYTSLKRSIHTLHNAMQYNGQHNAMYNAMPCHAV